MGHSRYHIRTGRLSVGGNSGGKLFGVSAEGFSYNNSISNGEGEYEHIKHHYPETKQGKVRFINCRQVF